MEFPFYLLVSAVVFSFYASFMGGANDFANSFGTSVGSGAITIRKAVFIAILANLFGAVFVGGHVTDTVRKGILDPMQFQSEPILLVFGLLASLVGSGLFLQIATKFGLPVSTTHAIVGAVVGFGIISSGFGSVKWANVGNIAMSWVLSPIGGGIVAYSVIKHLQVKVFRLKNPVSASNRILPVYVGLAIMVVTLAMVYKGLKNLHLDLPIEQAIGISGILGLIGLVISRRYLTVESTDTQDRQVEIVEQRFKYLQIFTAGYVAFAHGANDVANGVGPLAGIWTIYHHGLVGLKSQVPVWILLLGGTGIVLGLATFGRKVIETVGKKITAITPSRGFAAEFSAATVVLTFSKLGMPVSTTHTLVGAVIGVGFARGIGAIDLKIVGRIFTSWVVTIPAAAIATIITYLIFKMIFI